MIIAHFKKPLREFSSRACDSVSGKNSQFEFLTSQLIIITKNEKRGDIEKLEELIRSGT